MQVLKQQEARVDTTPTGNAIPLPDLFGRNGYEAQKSAVKELRRMWYDTLNPSPQKAAAAAHAYQNIKKAFISGESVFMKLPPYKVLMENLSSKIRTAPTFREFMRGGIKVDYHGLRYVSYNVDEEQSGFFAGLVRRPESYLVVPVMVSGFGPGSWVYSLLRANDRVIPDFPLIGYSSGNYDMVHGDHIFGFSDSDPMAGKLLISPSDLKLLRSNKDNPVLVVDDAIVSGETIRKITDALKDFGFKEIYALVERYKLHVFS